MIHLHSHLWRWLLLPLLVLAASGLCIGCERGPVPVQFALAALAVVLIAYALRRGLQPLRRLRTEIEARSETDLTPIDTFGVPPEVVPLIEAINTHMERRRQLDDAHRQFIADASRQLKAPLATLRAQAAQAAQALEEEDPEAARSIVAKIHDSTCATSRLVQQLLALARCEPSHMMPVGSVDLTEVARVATFHLLSQALDKAIELEFEQNGRLWVGGHALLLRELVCNLVDNAIRYTPAGGRIVVSALRDGAGQPLLQVEDNGPGIALAERERVFDRFYRGTSALGDGCGLGLAIVRQIAARHGAAVELGSAHDGGLCVAVRFPATG